MRGWRVWEDWVPRDQLQACAAANRMLRDELARVEGERDTLGDLLSELWDYTGKVEGMFGAQVAVRSYLSFPGDPAENKALGERVRAALAPFRKDGPHTSVSPAVAGSSQPAPGDET